MFDLQLFSNEKVDVKEEEEANMDLRTIDSYQPEVRISQDQEQKRIIGYGIVYNQRTKVGDFEEVIRTGAATKFLDSNPDIKARFNHQRGTLLGRTKSGTMEIEETPEGVRYTIYPPDTTVARDIIQSIERGDVDGSSFTFAVAPNGERVTRQEDGTVLREIFEFDRIGEMGPVEDPAYLEATANVRSAEEAREAYLASLRAQDKADNIDEGQRALLENRKKWLEIKSKYLRSDYDEDV